LVIQVIGLPCSGKTHVLKKIKALYKDYPLIFFDSSLDPSLPDFSKTSSIAILESAQGFDLPTDVTVKLNIKKFQYDKNCQRRSVSPLLDDHKSFLNYYTVPSHFDVFSQQELYKILSLLIKNEINKLCF
jgi:hypothetical protein